LPNDLDDPTAHAVVIGGGIASASTAYALRLDVRDVVLLEQGRLRRHGMPDWSTNAPRNATRMSRYGIDLTVARKNR
jgi:glycine/D-amino acid oxidase-like deaminating enzyme